MVSPSVLVDESLALLKQLSILYHLSPHCTPVLNDDQEFTSSLNLLKSHAISYHFWELPFPFSAALDPLQRSIKSFPQLQTTVFHFELLYTTKQRSMMVLPLLISASLKKLQLRLGSQAGFEFFTQFPTPETMGNLGTNLTRKVLWDRLGGHPRHLKWR